jgi:4-oxalmesaconate hydratase
MIIDPRSGHHYDDTRRYIEDCPLLGEEERRMVFEGNVRRVYSRLDALLAQVGLA